MAEILALVRASWLSALTYRLSMLLSVLGLLVLVVPMYFVARALDPLMAEAIASEGGNYFAFLLVGLIAFNFLSTAVSSLPGAIRSGIHTGTLEALLSTRARLPYLLTGLVSYDFLWTGMRAVVLLLAGAVLGAEYAWSQLLVGLAILILIVVSYVPFGLVAAALVLAFRTAGPLPQAAVVLSTLLGGVYYPTHVIPSWIQYVSDVIPLTYGLRALRQTLLEGLPLRAVASDVAILLGFTVLLLAIGAWAFSLALRYARRAGTLAQY